MSTAIMSRFDFGDNLRNSYGVLRDTAPSGLDLSSAPVRMALSRMASTPPTGASDLRLILGLAQQHRRLERTQSAPAPPVSAAPSAAISATTVNTSRYKTELCRPYEEFGVCKYGDKCQFAHGGAELRSLARHPKYKTELCRTFHTAGFCPYGPRCHFVHNQDEVMMGHPQHQQHHHHKGPMLAVRSASVSSASRASRPAALSPTLSLDSASSPPCSLSQSPTSSLGSFFSSEPELHSPNSAAASSPGALDDQRLPVFNRLSAVPIFTLNELVR